MQANAIESISLGSSSFAFSATGTSLFASLFGLSEELFHALLVGTLNFFDHRALVEEHVGGHRLVVGLVLHIFAVIHITPFHDDVVLELLVFHELLKDRVHPLARRRPDGVEGNDDGLVLGEQLVILFHALNHERRLFLFLFFAFLTLFFFLLLLIFLLGRKNFLIVLLDSSLAFVFVVAHLYSKI